MAPVPQRQCRVGGQLRSAGDSGEPLARALSKNADENRVFTGQPLIGEDAVYVAGYKLKDGVRDRVQLWSFDLADGSAELGQSTPCATINPLVLVGGTIVLVIWRDLRDFTICPELNEINYNGRTFLVDAETGDKASLGQAQFGASILYDDIPSTVSMLGSQAATGLQMWWMEEEHYPRCRSRRCPEQFASAASVSPSACSTRSVGHERRLDSLPRRQEEASTSRGERRCRVDPREHVRQGLPGRRPVPTGPVPAARPVIHWGQCAAVACAVDISTHQVLWTDPIAGTDPLVHNGVVYGACPARLCALDLRTGVELWSDPRRRLPHRSWPAVCCGSQPQRAR